MTTTDYDDLVERSCLCSDGLCDRCKELIAAIRELRAERDALRKAIEEMVEFATSTTAVVEIGRFALDPVKSRADFAAAGEKP